MSSKAELLKEVLPVSFPQPHSDSVLTPPPQRMAGNVTPAKVSAQPAVVSPRTPLRSISRPTASAAAYKGRPCFHCNQEGHWMRDCPNQRRKTSAADDSARADPGANALPDMMCACNRGPCEVREANGRKLYRCPLFDRELHSQMRCGYTRSCPKPEEVRVLFYEEPRNIKCPCGVGWCLRGEEDSGEYAGWSYLSCPGQERMCCFRLYYRFGDQQNVGGYPDAVSQCYPLCACGAGRCRLWMERKNGRQLGRLYFTCPILKGQGACNLIIWLDHLQGDEVMQQNHLPPEQIEEPDDYAQPGRPNVTGLPIVELLQDSSFDNMTAEDFDMLINEAQQKLNSSVFENKHVYPQTEICSNFSGAPAVTETADGMSSEGHPMSDGIVSSGDVDVDPQQAVQSIPYQVVNRQAPVIYSHKRSSFRQRVPQNWAQWLIETVACDNV